jgi:hypothetical protein
LDETGGGGWWWWVGPREVVERTVHSGCVESEWIWVRHKGFGWA